MIKDETHGSILWTQARNVKPPAIGTNGSAGIDFYIPIFDLEFVNNFNDKNPALPIVGNKIQIKPHERVLIPSGIKTIFNDTITLVAANKSGICTKYGLIVGAQVIDSDYRGEIHIHLINTSNETVYLNEGMKIVQFLPLKITEQAFDKKLVFISETSYSEYESREKTNIRKDNGFGSTDNKWNWFWIIK